MNEKLIENQTFDDERAFYGEKGLAVRGCRFDGPADGRIALPAVGEVIRDIEGATGGVEVA